MGTPQVTQAILCSKDEFDPNKASMQLAIFNEEGETIYAFVGHTQFVLDKHETMLHPSPCVVGNAIGTAGKTTVGAEPAAHTMVLLQFTNGNTADTPTVAFNGGTARAIKLGGTASAAAKLTLAANGIAQFYFDGTVLHQIGVYS